MSKRSKLWTCHVLTFLLGIGLLVVLVYFAGYQQILSTIANASLFWLTLAVLIYSCSWIFRIWRMAKFTDQAGNHVGKLELFKLYISGYALNILLPAKLGDAATVGYLRMQGINIGRSAAIVFQIRLLDLLALILLAMPSVFFLFKGEVPGWIKTTLLLCGIVLSMPLLVVLLGGKSRFSNLLSRVERKFQNSRFLSLTTHKVKDAYESYRDILSDKNLMLNAILLSLAIWLVEAVTCMVVAGAVNVKMPLAHAILAISVGNMGKSIPATPGSIGVYEAIVGSTLGVLGYSFNLAIAIAILDHLIKKLFNLAFGLPATMSIGVNISEIFQRARS
jgi:glycosyltransferase AglD